MRRGRLGTAATPPHSETLRSELHLSHSCQRPCACLPYSRAFGSNSHWRQSRRSLSGLATGASQKPLHFRLLRPLTPKVKGAGRLDRPLTSNPASQRQKA